LYLFSHCPGSFMVWVYELLLCRYGKRKE
jgi:hypothetical protein